MSIALPALPQARDNTKLYFSVFHFSVMAFVQEIAIIKNCQPIGMTC